jgi:DNA-binding XRE family transcriptional regulator
MNITEHIAACGKTRTAICEDARISRQSLHKIENRLTTPRIEVAVRLARAIGCPLEVVRPDILGMLS